eukprot:m.323997 g.323997  ORF g.323997 m.323997 type:complete len:87 (-) comp20365_c1_seq3:49-309(-)
MWISITASYLYKLHGKIISFITKYSSRAPVVAIQSPMNNTTSTHLCRSSFPGFFLFLPFFLRSTAIHVVLVTPHVLVRLHLRGTVV